MTQTELTRSLAKAFGLPHAHSQRILRALLDKIARALADGGRVSLRTFGSFHPVRRAGKKVRHPKTGELVTVPARRAVSFRPSPALEKRLR